MKFNLLLASVLLLACLRAPAQTPAPGQTAPTPPASQPTFAVASVKVSAPNGDYTQTSPWGTDAFSTTNASLLYLIELAYGVQPNQVVGEPAWFDSARYDVNAKTAGGVKLDWREVQAPLRHLLEERFHLATHREQKDFSGFALVVASGGPKLQPSKPDDKPYGYIVPNGIEAQNMNMGALVSMLAIPAGRPVVDRTAIAGNFKFKLSFSTANSQDHSLPDLFTAVQEQLGLKLDPQKVPVDMLVIDHVDKIPEN